MKIAIDCRLLGNSGIGVYLENILYHLIHNSSHTFLLIGDASRLKHFPRSEILSISIKPFSFKELLLFPTEEINQCDLFYSPNFNIPGRIKIPIYSTIHDVVFLDFRHLVPPLGYLIRYFFLKRAIYKSRKIFTVSAFSRERILAHFKTNKEIVIIYNGIAKYLKDKVDCNQEIYISEKYILFIGNIKRHKGIKILLEAYEKMICHGAEYRLVIVGDYKAFRTKDEKVFKILNSNNPHIVFTGKVSNDDLLKIISNASLLIQPSLYEGFGIPPLEALYLGVNVILSDIKVFKEIYGELPVCFFEHNNSDDLIRAIESVHFTLNTNAIRQLIDQKYNYQISAMKVLDAFNADIY